MDGLVFAVGGCDAWNCLNSVEVYDPSTDAWSYSKNMITARRGCGLAVFNGIQFLTFSLLYSVLYSAVVVKLAELYAIWTVKIRGYTL